MSACLADLGVYPKVFSERIPRSASLRHILVHDHNDADRRLICGSVRPRPDECCEYVECVTRFLGRLPPR